MDTSSFTTENNHTLSLKRPLPLPPPLPTPSLSHPGSKYEWSPNWNVACNKPLPLAPKYRKLHRRSPRVYSGSKTPQFSLVRTKGESASNQDLSKGGIARGSCRSGFQSPLAGVAFNCQGQDDIPFLPLFSPADQIHMDLQMATYDSKRHSELPPSFVDAFATLSVDSRQRTLEWTCYRESKRRRMSTIEESLLSPYLGQEVPS